MFIGLSVASLFRGGVADGRSRLGGFFFPSSRACLRPFALQSGLRVPTVPGFRLRPAVGCPERRNRRGLSSFYPTSPVRSSVAWGDRKKEEPYLLGVRDKTERGDTVLRVSGEVSCRRCAFLFCSPYAAKVSRRFEMKKRVRAANVNGC